MCACVWGVGGSYLWTLSSYLPVPCVLLTLAFRRREKPVAIQFHSVSDFLWLNMRAHISYFWGIACCMLSLFHGFKPGVHSLPTAANRCTRLGHIKVNKTFGQVGHSSKWNIILEQHIKQCQSINPKWPLDRHMNTTRQPSRNITIWEHNKINQRAMFAATNKFINFECQTAATTRTTAITIIIIKTVRTVRERYRPFRAPINELWKYEKN